MWTALFTALALVLIIEGLLPFLSPAGFRQSMQRASVLPDKQLRTAGFVSMAVGLILLYIVR